MAPGTTILHPANGAAPGADPVTTALREQQDLSAVDQFAIWHDNHAAPGPHRLYRNLLPATQPGPGQQYAFEVDLDKCSGCKACVSACHSLNGLDPNETWRTTGLLVSEDWRHPFHQTITTACHHCVDPACLNGCPVLAYDKDPITGIVRHLDDQCIGCQYCIMKCPYEVPRYSPTRGIVRKCDMCSHRLTRGEPPACVQACPNQAIRITLVETAALSARYRGATRARTPEDSPWLPDTPDPSLTVPTTLYQTRRVLPRPARAADREELHPQPAHTPLVIMLVLTQAATGLFSFAPLAAKKSGGVNLACLLGVATILLSAGLVASFFHLGRPAGAWRAFLALRTSWLSREILAFGFFALFGSLAFFAAATATPALPWLLPPAVLAGWTAVLCSVMVYADTGREPWRLTVTAPKFIGTAFTLGSVLALAFGTLSGAPAHLIAGLCLTSIASGLFKLAADHRPLRHLHDDDFSPRHKTALLQAGRFGVLDRTRSACTWLGTVTLPGLIAIAIAGSTTQPEQLLVSPVALLAALLALTGELIERYLFFVTVQTRRMPGNPAS
ncbi:MAG: molybdopterin oxidoreductase [Limisphaera sp.]|nr:MAG: molybdopterin oxidoreductase [Limisphaera sp.]